MTPFDYIETFIHYVGFFMLCIGLFFNIGSLIGQIINFVMKPRRFCSGNYAVFIFYILAGINQQKPFFCRHEMSYLFGFAIVTEILLPAISDVISNSETDNNDDE